MIRLAFLPLGARALRAQWGLLAAGGAWMALGSLILLDLTDGRLGVFTDTLGLLSAIQGSAETGAALALGPDHGKDSDEIQKQLIGATDLDVAIVTAHLPGLVGVGLGER